MRLSLAFLVILVCGCGRSVPSPQAAQLRFLKVVNDGNQAVEVDDVRLTVRVRVPLWDDAIAGRPPEGFDCNVVVLQAPQVDGDEVRRLEPGEVITIAPQESRDICGLLHWAVPDDTVPAVILLSAELSPRRGGHDLTTSGPLIIAMQSKPGAIATVEAAALKELAQLKQLKAAVEALDGEPTARVRKFIEGIRAAAGKVI